LGSKRVVRSDGTYDWFGDSSDTDRWGYGEYKTIADTWTDPEGNFFYKATFKDFISTSVLYELSKISSSGTEWERVWAGVDFPPEIDPNHSNYSIYYRQQNVLDIRHINSASGMCSLNEYHFEEADHRYSVLLHLSPTQVRLPLEVVQSLRADQ